MVNEQIWGNSEQWIKHNIFTNNNDVFVKFANTFRGESGGGHSADYWNNISGGAVYWGIGNNLINPDIELDNSACFHGAYVPENEENSLFDYWAFELNNNYAYVLNDKIKHNEINIPLLFVSCGSLRFFGNSGYNFNNNTPYSPYLPNATAEIDTTTIAPKTFKNIKDYNLTPIVDYKLNEIRFLILVKYTDNLNNNHVNNHNYCTDLYNYSKIYNSYPYVTAVILVPIVKNVTNFQKLNNLNLSISPLTNLTVENTKINYYSSNSTGIISVNANVSDSENSLINNQLFTTGILLGGFFNYFDLSPYQRFLIPGGNMFKNIHNYTYYKFVHHEVTDIDDFKNWCFRQAAFVGFPFSDRYYSVIDMNLNNNIHMGVRNVNGLTTGEWKTGNDIITQIPAYNWTKPNEESKYNPKSFVDKNKYISILTTPNRKQIYTFGRYYALNNNQIYKLYDFLNSIPAKASTMSLNDFQKWLKDNFLNENPIDNILFLKYFPLNTSQITMQGQSEQVKISNCLVEYDNGGTTQKLYGYTNPQIDLLKTLNLGYFEVYKAYDNFLDYEPYSTCKLYLPYTNIVDLDLKLIVEHKIYIKYKIDFLTGIFTAYVTLDNYDGKILTTAHGNLSIDIAISGIQTADYQNAIYQSIANLKTAQLNNINSYFNTGQTIFNVGANVLNNRGINRNNINDIANYGFNLEKNISDVISSTRNVKNAEYNLETAQIKHLTVGAASAGDGALMYQYPCLIVTRPKFLPGYNAEIYSHTVGNATIENTKVSYLNGYTVFSDIDLSNVVATEKEKQMLTDILKNGVYL